MSSLKEVVANAKRKALIDRVMREDDRTTYEHAFRLCVSRRWIVRVGVEGPNVDFRTVFGGRPVGWMFTDRGEAVACEEALRAEEQSF